MTIGLIPQAHRNIDAALYPGVFRVLYLYPHGKRMAKIFDNIVSGD